MLAQKAKSDVVVLRDRSEEFDLRSRAGVRAFDGFRVILQRHKVGHFLCTVVRKDAQIGPVNCRKKIRIEWNAVLPNFVVND